MKKIILITLISISLIISFVYADASDDIENPTSGTEVNDNAVENKFVLFVATSETIETVETTETTETTEATEREFDLVETSNSTIEENDGAKHETENKAMEVESSQIKENDSSEQNEKIDGDTTVCAKEPIDDKVSTNKEQELNGKMNLLDTNELELICVNNEGKVSIATNSEVSELFGDTNLDNIKYECVLDIYDISYFKFEKDDTLTVNENFDNWILLCDNFLNGDDDYNIDGFLHETKIREYFMYEYNGELIKRTAVRLTKQVLEALKNATSEDVCRNLTSEESEYKNQIHTLYVAGNDAYMQNWRNENSSKQDDDFRETLVSMGFAINEIDASSNTINVDGANAISIHILKSDFDSIVNTGSFTINSPIAKIRFSENCLNNISNSNKFEPTTNYNGSQSLYINISIIKSEYVDGSEELNETQSRLVRALNKNIVDIVVKNARGEKIDLNGGLVEISIPYELGNGEEDNITIWYINSQGKLEYHVARFENGWVNFKTTHFSPYFQYKGIRKTIWEE